MTLMTRAKPFEWVDEYLRDNRELKKFPLLVGQDSLLAVLILHHCHEATLHGGAELTVNSSREELEFWRSNAKVSVKKVIKIASNVFVSRIKYHIN